MSSTLDALARAIATADENAVERHLGSGWRHGFARRQVRRALTRARARIASWGGQGDTVGDRVFMLQLAWLDLARETVTFFDPAWVQDRYYAVLAARSAPGFGKKRRLVALGLGATIVAIAAIVLATRGGDEAPTSVGATMSEAQETPWADAVTTWVIALDRYSRARADHDADADTRREELTALEAAVLPPDVRAFFGPDATEAIEHLLAAARKLATSQHFERDDEAFAAALRDANHVLARADRGYFFDGHGALYPDGRVETRVFLFRVAARQRWRDAAAGENVDAVHLRRLDRVNLVQLLIGYTSKRMDVAVVLLDKVEEVLVESLLPALPQAAPRPMHFPSDFGDAAARDGLGRLGGIAIRDVVSRGFADAYPRLAAAGRALAARNAALEAEGLRPFESLRIAPAARAQLEGALSPAGRARVDDAEAQLGLSDTETAATALLARAALSVEHHEVQHRLDYALGERFMPPGALMVLMGVTPDKVTRDERDPVLHTAYELSAYTAELARDPEWALINLASLVEQSLDGDSDEFRASQMLLSGLQDVLAVEPAIPVIALAHGQTSTSALANALLAVAPRGAEAIANGARALYERWFERPVPAIDPVVPDAPPQAGAQAAPTEVPAPGAPAAPH